MQQLFHVVLDELRAGRSLVSVVIHSHKGSTPRTAGARLLVFTDGRTHGTVGGGRYEAEAVNAARALLAADSSFPRPAAVLEYSLHGVTDMDMICGGELALFLQRLDPDEETLALYTHAVEAEDTGRAFCLTTHVSLPTEGKTEVLRRELLRPDASGEAFPLDGETPRLRRETDRLILTEPFPLRRRLFLFGAGHVSRALALLAETLDYGVVVLEDRPEFASAERFPLARRLLVPDQHADTLREALVATAPASPDAAVILTRGHAHDRDALQAALAFPFGYIGMIGSRTKREAVYAQLREKGVPAERLLTVHCPVGLAIGAQTPEEIAVSIAAELIAERNRS